MAQWRSVLTAFELGEKMKRICTTLAALACLSLLAFGCSSNSSSAGSGGEAGSAGMGGVAGMAGAAGEGGNAGVGGTGGMGGVGGEAGAGGEAGVGGAAGAGGAAGEAGAGGVGGAIDDSDCRGLCTYLEMCNACFFDENGECLDIDGCVSVCLAETSPAVAACVSGLEGCDGDAFQGCYDSDIGDDDCAQTCRFLEECGECFTDENGECLTLAGCAVVCRESTPPAAAACIAQLDDCDGIGDCYSN